MKSIQTESELRFINKRVNIQNFMMAIAVFMLLMIWFALTFSLRPLFHSISLAFVTALWVFITPILIRVFNIRLFSFTVFETQSSNMFYCKMQIGKYLNSLECSLSEKQLIWYPIFQILTFVGFYQVFKYLNHLKDPNLVLLFICVMTLGMYLSMRSLIFTALLMWSKYIKPVI